MNIDLIERIVKDEPSIILRQFHKRNARALWNLVDVNRDYLIRHGEFKAAEYVPFDVFEWTIVCPLNPSWFRFGIWAENTVVGKIELEVDDESQSGRVWSFIDEKQQGKKYATSSLQRVVEFAFEERRLSKVSTGADQENPSRRVLSAAGFLETERFSHRNGALIYYARERTPADTLIKVILYPCKLSDDVMGWQPHGYVVDKMYASGETFSYTDFLTLEQVKERYGYLGEPEIIDDPRLMCIRCNARASGRSLSEVMKEIRLLKNPPIRIREDMYRA